MKLHVISLIAAAVSIGGPMTEARSKPVRDGMTPERAIVIPHSKRNFRDLAFDIICRRYPDAKRRAPYELAANPLDAAGRNYEVGITFSTKSHGNRMMWFRTTYRDLAR
jgi:hypothetical protein